MYADLVISVLLVGCPLVVGLCMVGWIMLMVLFRRFVVYCMYDYLFGLIIDLVSCWVTSCRLLVICFGVSLDYYFDLRFLFVVMLFCLCRSVMGLMVCCGV